MHRQGGHSDGSTHLLPSPAASINISSGIFISSHSPTSSVDIQNNAAQRMLKLLNGDAKINLYEPSCSRNTVWHFKCGTSQFCQEGVHRKGFTEAIEQRRLCSSTFVGSVCYGQDGPEYGAEMRTEVPGK